MELAVAQAGHHLLVGFFQGQFEGDSGFGLEIVEQGLVFLV